MEKEQNLEEGIYSLLVNSENRIKKIEKYLENRVYIPQTYKQFKNIDDSETVDMLIGSLSGESVILEALSQAYQSKRTAINIIVKMNTNEKEFIQLSSINEIMSEGFLLLNDNENAIDEALEKIQNIYL